MSGEATGTGSSGTLPKTSPEKGTSERRRYDVTGNIPQWITSILLAIIGCLLLMVWNSMDSRVKAMEAKLDAVVAAQAAKTSTIDTELATLKVQRSMHDATISELKSSHQQMMVQVGQMVGELKLLNLQLKK